MLTNLSFRHPILGVCVSYHPVYYKYVYRIVKMEGYIGRKILMLDSDDITNEWNNPEMEPKTTKDEIIDKMSVTSVYLSEPFKREMDRRKAMVAMQMKMFENPTHSELN